MLPFISGARIEGYLKLKDPQKKKKTIKMKPLKLWKTRYCVVMGPHWLVYTNQSQAISSSTSVAVYELLEADGEDETEFSLHVLPGRHVKCRARSSLERKRWANAVEDELLTQAKTTEDLTRSVKEREDKLAAREAVKSKLQEVKTDARRLSALLGEAIQNSQGDSDTGDESETRGDSSGGGFFALTTFRSGLYRRQSREFSDAEKRGGKAFPFDTLDAKDSEATQSSPSSFLSFFTCFFCSIPMSSADSKGKMLGSLDTSVEENEAG